MWWHAVTHGRISDGEPVSVTWQQNTGLHEQYKPCRLIRTPRLPVVDWTDAPADLNGLVRLAEDEIWFLRMCHHISNAVYRSCFLRVRAGRDLAASSVEVMNCWRRISTHPPLFLHVLEIMTAQELIRLSYCHCVPVVNTQQTVRGPRKGVQWWRPLHLWNVTQRRLVVADVSAQTVGFLCRSELTLEDETDKLFRNVGNYRICAVWHPRRWQIPFTPLQKFDSIYAQGYIPVVGVVPCARSSLASF